MRLYHLLHRLYFLRLYHDGVGAVLDFADAHQIGCQLEHLISERNDHKLGLLGPLLNVASDDRDISKVQSSIDFIHHVKRGRAHVMQCEDKRETRNSLFSSGEIADVLPALFGGSHGKLDSIAKRIEGVNQFKLRISTVGDGLIYLL